MKRVISALLNGKAKVANARGVALHPMMAAALCIVLAHLPFWIVQPRLFELRPVFSYDLLGLLLLGAVLGRPLVGLLLLCWVLDGFQSVATSFHFANAADFAGTLRFARLLQVSQFLSTDTVGLAALFVGGGLLLAVGMRQLRVSAPVLLFVTVLVVGLDIVNGSTSLPGLSRDTVMTTTNIAGSPLWNMVSRLKASSQVENVQPQPWTPMPASYAALLDWSEKHPDGSVLVVLVESMGLPQASEMRDAMLAPLRSALQDSHWSFELTDERFSGGTTHGELRVLCGLDGRYQSFRDGEADARPCMPVRRAAQGYATVGLHGFTGQMFDRQQWWPRVGLRERLFAEELAHDDNRCGEAFLGVCDAALLREAVKRLNPGPSFAYALTLNTHLPLRDGAINPIFQQKCTRLRVPHLPCLLMARQTELMRDLGETLRVSSVRPLVVITGDHAPPFGNVGDRAAFSAKRVPVLILRPLS